MVDSGSGAPQRAGTIRTPASASNIEVAAVLLNADVLNFMGTPGSAVVNAFIRDSSLSLPLEAVWQCHGEGAKRLKQSDGVVALSRSRERSVAESDVAISI
jgi:hypothetical protein